MTIKRKFKKAPEETVILKTPQIFLQLFEAVRTKLKDPIALDALCDLFTYSYYHFTSFTQMVDYWVQAIEPAFQMKALEFFCYNLKLLEPLIEISGPQAVTKKELVRPDGFLAQLLHFVRLRGHRFERKQIRLPDIATAYHQVRKLFLTLLYLSELKKIGQLNPDQLSVNLASVDLLYLLLLGFLQSIRFYFSDHIVNKNIEKILEENHYFSDRLVGLGQSGFLDLKDIMAQKPAAIQGINMKKLLAELIVPSDDEESDEEPVVKDEKVKKKRKKKKKKTGAKKPQLPAEPPIALPSFSLAVLEPDVSRVNLVSLEESEISAFLEPRQVVDGLRPEASEDTASSSEPSELEKVSSPELDFDSRWVIREMLKNYQRFLRRVDSIKKLTTDPAFLATMQAACDEVSSLRDHASLVLNDPKPWVEVKVGTAPQVDDPLPKFRKELASLNWNLYRLAQSLVAQSEDRSHFDLGNMVLDHLGDPTGLSTFFHQPLTSYFTGQEIVVIQAFYDALASAGITLLFNGSRILFPECPSYDWDVKLYTRNKQSVTQADLLALACQIDPKARVNVRGCLQVCDGQPLMSYEIKFSQLEHPLDVTFYLNPMDPKDLMGQLKKSWLSVCSAFYDSKTQRVYVEPEVARTLFRGLNTRFSASNELELLSTGGLKGLLKQGDCAGLAMRMRVKLRDLDLEISPLIQSFEQCLGQVEIWDAEVRPLLEKAIHYFMIHFWKAPLAGVQYLHRTKALQGLLPTIPAEHLDACFRNFFEIYKGNEGEVSKRIKTQVCFAILFSTLLAEQRVHQDIVFKALRQLCDCVFWRVSYEPGNKKVDYLCLELLQAVAHGPFNPPFLMEEAKKTRAMESGGPAVNLGLSEWALCLKSVEGVAFNTATTFLGATATGLRPAHDFMPEV